MPTKRNVITLAINRVPPKEFRVWSFGKIDTTKGTFLFDDKGAKSVLDAQKRNNNRITFDYEHKAIDPDRREGEGKSAGSCKLELRKDGLYAVDVRWTPKAAKELTDGEWLYFSPAFSNEEKTGRILELINIALTNIPATRGMTPLVAASRGIMTKEEKAALRKASLKRLAEMKEELAKLAESLADEEDEEEETPPSSKEEVKTSDEPKSEPEPTKTSDEEKAKDEIAATARSLTGCSKSSDVIGALYALSIAAKAPKAPAPVDDFDAEKEVGKLVASGKIAPVQKADIVALAKSNRPAFYALSKHLVPIVTTPANAARKSPDVPAAGNGKLTVQMLSKQQKETARMMNVSPEQFVETHNRNLASRNERLGISEE